MAETTEIVEEPANTEMEEGNARAVHEAAGGRLLVTVKNLCKIASYINTV